MKEVMHMKEPYLSPKRSLTNQIHLENEQSACVLHQMGKLKSRAPPPILMPKCGNDNRLGTLQLEYHIMPTLSKHIYANNSLKTTECCNIKLNSQCEHRGHLLMNINNTFTLSI